MSGSIHRVRAAYGARATEYTRAVGSIGHAAAPDVEFIERWACDIDGPVLDIGCGPGQWTNHLARLGVEVEGIDPVPEFVETARRTYPGRHYRIGRAEDLAVADGALGGVLAWYSLIHTAPDRIGVALAEFGRGVRAGGGLALGFFTGPELVAFDHAITTAYAWPLDLIAAAVETAGFAVGHTEARTDPGTRPHGELCATRS